MKIKDTNGYYYNEELDTFGPECNASRYDTVKDLPAEADGLVCEVFADDDARYYADDDADNNNTDDDAVASIAN